MELENREVLLVVIGAGASFDSIPTWQLGGEGNPLLEPAHLARRPFRDTKPPLTQDLAKAGPLVNWALDRWPQARPAVAHLRQVLGDSGWLDADSQVVSLEAALGAFQSDGVIVPENLRSLLGFRFFLRDLIWASTDYTMSSQLTGGVTNYTSLLQHLALWAGSGDRAVVIVSFNYDLLLERAMESMWGFDPTHLESYLAHDRIHLLKPHGSLQWEWLLAGHRGYLRAPPTVHGAAAIDQALVHGEDTSSLQTRTMATYETDREVHSQLAVPAMALPLDGKSSFCWPEEQRARFESLQGTVTRMVTIGWRGIEEHFTPLLRPLVKEWARVLVVTGGAEGDAEGQEVIGRLRRHTDVSARGSWSFDPRGFTEFLLAGSLNELLS